MRSKTPGAAWGPEPSTISNSRPACAALAAKRVRAKGLMSLATTFASGQRAAMAAQRHDHAPQLLSRLDDLIRQRGFIQDAGPIHFRQLPRAHRLGPAKAVQNDGLNRREEVGLAVGDVIDRVERGDPAIGLLQDVVDLHGGAPPAPQPVSDKPLPGQNVLRHPAGNDVAIGIHPF